MYIVFRPLRLLLKALLTEATPQQMSLGLAMGILIGLVPKGNLLAVSLGMILAATQAQLAIAGGAAVTIMAASRWIDPFLDVVGSGMLSSAPLHGFWTWLYNVPGLPWTDFNNSIVLGGFLIGLVLLAPVYLGTQPMFARISPKIADYARRFRIVRALLGAEWADRVASVS